MWGGTVESKNTTFVVPRSLQTLFDCKFIFLMILIDSFLSVVVMRG
jgi:hypothetical protein